MLKKLLKNTKFKSAINDFYKENKNIINDILLFGSVLKGREKPNDIDIMIFYKNKKNLDLDYELRKKLEKAANKNVQITSVLYEDFLNPNFIARTAFFESYSLIYKKKTAESFGFKTIALFKYSLKKLSKSERMIFYYALYGRDKKSKGILKTTNSIKFSPEIILTPIGNSEEIKCFLTNRNVDYDDCIVLMHSLMFEHLRK